jgi:type I restriction enzyme R subunit
LNAQNHILGLGDGKNRYNEAIYLLNKSYAIAKTTDEAEDLRDDIVFFRDVHGRLNTRSAAARDPGEIDSAIRQLVSDAIQPGEVIDVFEAAGLKRPDISILDDEFLAEIQRMPHRNLAVELLEKLLKGELRQRRKINLVQEKIFSDMLNNVLIRYRNRGMDTLQVIEDLIELAKKMREASARGDDLGLDFAELAFYDALETNDSAVAVLGDEILKTIARDVAKIIRSSTTIDWTMREEVQAQMRVLVKRILKKYGYPPDNAKKATDTVLEQAKLMASELASA